MEEKSKIEHQQPLVVILHLARGFGGNGGLRRFRQFDLVAKETSGGGSGMSVSFWNSKIAIFCGLPSSVTDEVTRLQVLDGLAGFVFDRDVDDHQVAGGAELGYRAVRLLDGCCGACCGACWASLTGQRQCKNKPTSCCR